MEKSADDFGFYTVAWCVPDNWNMSVAKDAAASESALRKAVPFEILGKSSLVYGSRAKITLIILEGFDHLSKEYLCELERSNFRVINYDREFRKIVSRFANISDRYNRFERNCFLRWLALKDIAKKDAVSHFLHIDSDMALYASLEEIAKETQGKTFMLEGCPALVSVSDFAWFETYEEELKKFETDISRYSNEAFRIKKTLPENNLEICNTAVWRNPLGSDQDFLEYLISNGKLPQSTSGEIFNSKFFFIQNPLLIKYWSEKAGIGSLEKITEKDGSIFYGTKRIPFTHYQGTFCYYANILLIAQEFFPFNLLSMEKHLHYTIDKTKFRLPKMAKYIWKAAKIFNWRMDRTDFVRCMESQGRKKHKRILDILDVIASSDKNKFVIEKEN